MYVVWNHETRELIGVSFTQKGANKLREREVKRVAIICNTTPETVERLQDFVILKAKWVF